MQKKLLSGLFWVLLANLVVKPFWLLGVEVGVQHAVGDEVYGFYISIFNLSYIFNILLDLGITNFNTRNIARNPQRIERHLNGILGIKVCLLPVYLIVTFTVGALWGYTGQEFKLLAWLSVAQFLNSLLLYLRSNFEGLLLFRWDSLFSVLDRLVMIVICGLMIWSPLRSYFNIFWFVYAQVAAYALAVALALAVLARKTSLGKLRFDRKFFVMILKRSAPFALLVLLMASYNRLDPILLRRLASDSAAGVYAGAFRLLDALTMVAYLVSVPLLPVFSRLCGEGNRTQIANSVRLVFPSLMAFAVAVAAILSAHAEPVMALLYGDMSEAYVPVFSVLIWGLVPVSVTYVFGTLLTADGRLLALNLFALIALVLNVLANIMLIPRLGACGSAWASLLAQGFMALAQWLMAMRRFGIKLSDTCFWQLCIYAIISSCASIYSARNGWGWRGMVAVCAGVIVLSLLLRLVNVRMLLQAFHPATTNQVAE